MAASETPEWDTYPYEDLFDPLCIRLLRIDPRAPDQPKSSSIQCRLREVALCHEALIKGEPTQPPKRPTVRFDEYVTFQHKEIYKVLAEEKRGVVRRAMDKIRGRTAEQRRSRVIERLPQIAPRDVLMNQTNLIRHEEVGDQMSLVLGMEDENGNMTSLYRQIPPEMARDATEPPEDEPQYRDRFKWSSTNRHAKYLGNYVAMSYTWGDPDDRVPIFIDGHSVHVTTNLEEGLREFRELEPFKKGLWIWIDAVCINQNNPQERDAQVKMMSAIYEQAGNIIVWLGPRDKYSDEAIDYLHVTSINYRTEYVEAMDHTDLYLAHNHRNDAQMKLKSAMHMWSDLIRSMANTLNNEESMDEMVQLYQFFNRPYWRRLWIIQELAMGRAGMPIVCGSTVTQWRYVRDGVFMMSSALEIFHELIPKALSERGIPMEHEPSILHVATIAQLESAGHRKPLPELPAGGLPLAVKFHSGRSTHGPLRGDAVHMALRLIRDSHATKTIDRVYGMLAIPGLPSFQLEVSYEKDTGEAFVDFIKQVILLGHSPAVFQFLDGTGASLSDNYQIPFWCPNLGAKPGRRIGIIEGLFHASDPTGTQVPFSWGRQMFLPEFVTEEGEEHLVCRGFITDAIDGLGAVSMTDRENMRFGSLFQGGVVQPKFDAPWPYEDEPEDIVWWTLVGGTQVGGEGAPSKFSCLLSAIPFDEPPTSSPDHKLWDFIQTSKDLPIAGRPVASYFTPRPLGAPTDFTTAPARQAMAARTSCRRLATTPKGRVALVPASTQPGDAIIILLGHGSPVVATCIVKDDGNTVYKIKGDAFVHGIMEGEAVRTDIFETDRDWFDEFHFI
ncbi:Fc.00g016980.m01.CDS01 [Cosmosporella sp. VM-42]